MSDLILHGLPPSTYCRTAMLALALKGIEYTLDPVALKSEGHGALHPYLRIPALHHGDVHIYETLAVTTYVDAVFEGRPLQPSVPAQHARMLQWVSVTNAYIYRSVIERCVIERFVKPMRGAAPDLDVIRAAEPQIKADLTIVDTGLENGGYLAGRDLSLADLFLIPIIDYFAATPEGKALMPTLTNLGPWQARVYGQLRNITPGFDFLSAG